MLKFGRGASTDKGTNSPSTDSTISRTDAAPSPGKSFSSRLLKKRPSTSKAHGNNVSGPGSGSDNTPSGSEPASTTFGNYSDSSPAFSGGPGARPRFRSPFPTAQRDVLPRLDSPLSINGHVVKQGGSDEVVVIDAGGDGPSPGTSTGSTASRSRPKHPFITSARNLDGDEAEDLTPPPVFPTALSPPRRTMPKSPRARGATPTKTGIRSPPPLNTAGSDSSNSSSLSAARVTKPPGRPTVTAEWLSQKPSKKRLSGGSSSGFGGHTRIPSGSGSFGRTRPTDRVPRDVGEAAEVGDASTSGVDSEDGQVGIITSRRRSQISSSRDGGGTYTVEILCVDNREEEDEMEWKVTIKRQKPRDSQSSGESNPPNTSPLHLSTAQSVARAPSTASSINLSLSLDQPTGKLVFIAFPMDLHATPRRRPSTAKASNLGINGHTVPPRGPTPPLTPSRTKTPPPSRSHNIARPSSPPLTPSRRITPPPALARRTTSSPPTTPLRRPSPPPAPNPNSESPPSTPPPQSRVKRLSESSMWPSPSRSGHRSPITTGSGGSGRKSPLLRESPGGSRTPEGWTPRRTRMVSATELGGGLYAKGTVDGMSEELERD